LRAVETREASRAIRTLSTLKSIAVSTDWALNRNSCCKRTVRTSGASTTDGVLIDGSIKQVASNTTIQQVVGAESVDTSTFAVETGLARTSDSCRVETIAVHAGITGDAISDVLAEAERLVRTARAGASETSSSWAVTTRRARNNSDHGASWAVVTGRARKASSLFRRRVEGSDGALDWVSSTSVGVVTSRSSELSRKSSSTSAVVTSLARTRREGKVGTRTVETREARNTVKLRRTTSVVVEGTFSTSCWEGRTRRTVTTFWAKTTHRKTGRSRCRRTRNTIVTGITETSWLRETNTVTVETRSAGCALILIAETSSVAESTDWARLRLIGTSDAVETDSAENRSSSSGWAIVTTRADGAEFLRLSTRLAAVVSGRARILSRRAGAFRAVVTRLAFTSWFDQRSGSAVVTGRAGKTFLNRGATLEGVVGTSGAAEGSRSTKRTVFTSRASVVLSVGIHVHVRGARKSRRTQEETSSLIGSDVLDGAVGTSNT
jgi:hypothetical protein